MMGLTIAFAFEKKRRKEDENWVIGFYL